MKRNRRFEDPDDAIVIQLDDRHRISISDDFRPATQWIIERLAPRGKWGKLYFLQTRDGLLRYAIELLGDSPELREMIGALTERCPQRIRPGRNANAV